MICDRCHVSSCQALLAALLLLLAVCSDGASVCPKGGLDNCSPCQSDADCCQDGVCGCIVNPIQGGPVKVCRCQGFDLSHCVQANVQVAKANAKAAAAATGQSVQDDDAPLPDCVKVPKGFKRLVPCEERNATNTTAPGNSTSSNKTGS